jgi:hypothetical protein
MSTTALSLMLIVAIVVSLLKPILELGLKPNTALHDTGIRITALLAGLVGAVLDYAIHTHNWWNGPGVETALGIGLAAGVGAIATFHLLTADVWSTLTPGQSTVLTIATPEPVTQPPQVTVATTDPSLTRTPVNGTPPATVQLPNPGMVGESIVG